MNKNLKLITVTAMLAALTYVATSIVKVPTVGTNGYVNIGDTMVLLSAWILGNPFGAVAAGVGSALADLLAGYGAYVPGTFVIKFAMAFFGYIAFVGFKKVKLPKTVAFILCSVIAEAIMVLGYFAYESTLLGYGLAAAASIPSNIIQGVTCLVLANILIQALTRIRYFNILMEEFKTKEAK